MTPARADYSRQDWSYALRLANRGYDERMIFRALAAKPSGRRDPGSIKYQRILDERGRDAADAYAQHTAEGALAWVAANPAIRDRVSALVALLQIRGAAESLPWAIYGGPGVRRALEAAFLAADRLGGVRLGLPLRRWAELAGVTFDSIRERRDKLVRMGWLCRDPRDRPGRTARYGVRLPSCVLPTFTSQGGLNVGALVITHSAHRLLAHDAFRGGALGDAGWYVAHSLNGRREPLRELGLRTGIREEALWDLMARLDRAGVIEVADDTASLAPHLFPRLDAIASASGTQGAGEADRLRHLRERNAFRRGGVNVGSTDEA
jgi:hypothetical protein